ncbi:MAG: winged helix-turn-helix domain-containing protein [Beijerinckiaceae bacterium]
MNDITIALIISLFRATCPKAKNSQEPPKADLANSLVMRLLDRAPEEANMIGARILVVERERPLAHLIQSNLEAAGYKASIDESIDALEICHRRNAPDLIILDAILSATKEPDLFAWLRACHGKTLLPIITLVENIECGLRRLHAGADDFLVKPFMIRELLARLGALLRRLRPNHNGKTIRVAGIKLDRRSRRVMHGKCEIHLSPIEFRLLELLMCSPGRVFSRTELVNSIWGPKADTKMQTVDVHIGRLRKALHAANSVDTVRTVRGAGYAIKGTVGSETLAGAMRRRTRAIETMQLN